jgi:phosphate starvation-inducible protein PhoH
MEDSEITVCNGLAGSGKTYVALYYALKALEKGQCEKIVLVKSVTTLD